MTGPADPNQTIDALPGPAPTAEGGQAPSEAAPALRQLDLAGRYLIVAEIATGGMGVVLKGHDRALRRDLAVKLLREAHKGKPELVRRFLEEAQIGGRLQHPGIAPIYDLGQLPDARPFFVMKLVQGQTLAALLAARKEPAEDRLRFLSVFAQIRQTVAYAHATGIIHRDLKPANVMVGAFGEVQVMDWGLAKILASHGHEPAEDNPGPLPVTDAASSPIETQVGQVMGTPAYMAPEQARGEAELLDERCDVFGLGAILCEILTGRPPYAGADTLDVHRRAAAGDLVEALSRLGGCAADRELLELARRCLAIDREDRPRDAGAVAAAVTEYLQSAEKRVRQAELAGAEARARAGEERKRRRLKVALTAVVLVVLAGGGTVYWHREQQQAETAALVETALERAQRFEAEGNWAEARNWVKKAEGALAGGGSAELRASVAQVRADLEMAAGLELVHLQEANPRGGLIDPGATSAAYAAAFRAYGITAEADDLTATAERVANSAIREQLVDALDDWLPSEPDAGQRVRLLAVLRKADPDPWRNRFRKAVVANDRQALKELADSADVTKLGPTVLTALADALRGAGELERVTRLLRRGQRQYPSDFWVNFQFADCLTTAEPPRHDEAVGFLRAAVAVLPRSSAAHYQLGLALVEQARWDEAEASFRRAAALQPEHGDARWELAQVLQAQGRHADAEAASRDAVDAYRKALAGRPDEPRLHEGLTGALKKLGRFAEALPHGRKRAERLAEDDPERGPALAALRACERLVELGPRLEAILRGDVAPADASQRLDLATLCAARKLYAAAARFAAEALAAAPELAEDVKAGHRYRAARAAALAANVQGEDGPRWRKQAVAWLGADLVYWARQLEGEPTARAEARRRLRRWRSDPDLASLRDTSALPAEERQTCDALWAEVARLLRRAGGTDEARP